MMRGSIYGIRDPFGYAIRAEAAKTMDYCEKLWRLENIFNSSSSAEPTKKK